MLATPTHGTRAQLERPRLIGAPLDDHAVSPSARLVANQGDTSDIPMQGSERRRLQNTRGKQVQTNLIEDGCHARASVGVAASARRASPSDWVHRSQRASSRSTSPRLIADARSVARSRTSPSSGTIAVAASRR